MNANDIPQRTANIIAEVLREFVLDKAALAVTFKQVAEHITLTIDCHPADCGRIIGGRGMHFRSLQAFANVVGLRHDLLFDINPMPEPTGDAKRYDPFKGLDVWRQSEIMALLARLVAMAVEDDDAVQIEARDLPCHTTKLTVHVARTESSAIIRTMTFGIVGPDGLQTGWLRVLANAIGKANGRTLQLDVVQDRDATDRQPECVKTHPKAWAGDNDNGSLRPAKVPAGQRRKLSR